MGALACLVTVFAVPAVRRAAVRFGVVDHPDTGRRIHARATPRAGGAAIFVALLVAAGVARLLGVVRPDVAAMAVPLFGGGAVLLVAGLVDDRIGLSPSVKLAAQVAAACVALALGFRPGLPFVPPVLGGVTFVTWVLLVTNSFNLIDGMDGLASSVAVVAAVSTAFLAWQLGDGATMTVSVVLAGALLGFLRHNSPPAVIFLGDSGSLSVGFWLAAVTAAAAHAQGRPVALVSMLCALPLPLLDTLTSVVRRWLRHRPVFSPDARHVHHRLLALGYRPRGVIALVYLFSSITAALGVGVSLAPQVAAVTLGVLGAALLVWFVVYWSNRLAYHEFVEAARLLLDAPRRARVGIRNQILARDVVADLATASSLAEVRLVLNAHAPAFGCVHMCVMAAEDVGLRSPGGEERDRWLIAHPLGSTPTHEAWLRSERAPTLVVELDRSDRGRADLAGVDRVLCGLVPALEAWFAEHPTQLPGAGEHGGNDTGVRDGRFSPADARHGLLPARARAAVPAARAR